MDGPNIDTLHHISDLRQADRRTISPGLNDSADPVLYPLLPKQKDSRIGLSRETSPLESNGQRQPISNQNAKSLLLVLGKPSHVRDQNRQLLSNALTFDHIRDTDRDGV
jgi:hypothetical protein